MSLIHIFIWNISRYLSGKYQKLSHYSKKETTEMSYYRPLALLPIFSNINKKPMSIRLLIRYLENNNFIDNEQHSFRAGRSVVMATVHSVDNGEKVLGLFLDL